MTTLPVFTSELPTPKQFGAQGNTRYMNDGAIAVGQAALTSASASWTSADIGKAVTVLGAGAPIAAVTGSIAPNVVTGSIAGNQLTVTTVTSGILVPGQAITGSNVAAGTIIVSYNSGTGGTGTYNLNTIQTVASTTLTASGACLTVSAVASGTLASGQTITGSGITAGTAITLLGSGSGGTGTYARSTSQNVASTAITVPGPLNTTIAWVAGNVATLNANAIATVSGAGISVGTDDTAAIMAWINATLCAAQGAQVSARWSAGTYKITSTLTIATPYSNTLGSSLPNLFTDGAMVTILDSWAVPTGPAIYVTGANGSIPALEWQGLQINGGANYGLNEGIRDNSAYMVKRGWHFSNLAIGIRFYNLGGSTFTEGVEYHNCSFDGDGLTNWVRFSVGSGTNSFRSSGLVGCQGHSPGHTPVVQIDAGALPYLAPLDFTCWTTGSPTALIYNNKGSAPNPSFVGKITVEGNVPMVYGIGGRVFFAGPLMTHGWPSSGSLNLGALFKTRDMTTFSNGAQGANQEPWSFSTAGTNSVGQTISIPFTNADIPNPGNNLAIATCGHMAVVHLVCANYDYKAWVLITNDAWGANFTAQIIGTPYIFNAAGLAGTVSLGVTGDTLTFSGPNWPIGTTADGSVTPLGCPILI